MLEKKFSASFGYAVRLTGTFRISLFPRIAVEGSGFELEAPQIRRLLARAEDYSVSIHLLPFLQSEVQVASVTLRGGFLDLGAFVNLGSHSAAVAPRKFSLPEVRSLIIESFSLVFGNENSIITLKRVKLDKFASGREAPLEVDAGWSSEGIELARVVLDGSLQIGQAIESARLRVNGLRIIFADSEIADLSGSWDWNQSSSQLSGDMNWIHGAYVTHSEMEFILREPVSGDLRIRSAESPTTPGAGAQAHFILRDDQLELPEVSLEWGGQFVAGAGCYRLAEPPGLSLALASDKLDLDAINALLLAGTAGDSELPFALSLVLHVGSANYMGALARNVKLEVGDELACPDIPGFSP